MTKSAVRNLAIAACLLGGLGVGLAAKSTIKATKPLANKSVRPTSPTESSAASTTGYKVGDAIANFTLLNVDNKKVSLAEYANAKGAIVVFTCNHCPFSQAYEGRIMTLDAKYAPKGYPVIAINPNDPGLQPDDSFAEMQKRAKERGYSFPYLLDDGQATAKAFGAKKTPQVYVVSKAKSGYTLSYMGAIDDNSNEPDKVSTKYTEAALEALLAGRQPSPNTTVAVGCSIKWKQL